MVKLCIIIRSMVNHTPRAGNFAANKNDHNSGIKSPVGLQIKNQVVCFNQTFILVPCFN